MRILPEAEATADVSSIRRRIQKTSTKRQQLLDAVHRVVNRRGYIDTTVNEIIEEAGVSRATFYGYFSDKDDIFVTLCRDLIAETRRRMRLPGVDGRNSTPRQQPLAELKQIVRDRIRIYLDQWVDEAPIMRGIMVLKAAAPELANQILQDGVRTRAEATRWLRRDREAGGLRGDIDPEVAMEALHAMMEGFAFRNFANASNGISVRDTTVLAEQLATIWFDGVYLHTRSPDDE